jgi:hypothetical protein
MQRNFCEKNTDERERPDLKSTPVGGARHLCRINVKKPESLGIIQMASIANSEAA